ncbi:hypothetical protein HWV62_24586 [Athelia sp. TMB]|nr:hypothetical protein HWV62_24586 [Athelia sp. TMB]
MSEVNIGSVLQFTHPSWFSNEVIIAPKVNFTTCSGMMMSEPSLVTNPHRGAPSPTIYLGTANRTHLDNPDPSMLQNYAMDLILAFAWAILVAGLVVLLEFTAKHASKVEKQPWYYDWLPTIALTIFTQVHGPITAAFDARIAVSTLKTAYAPKTWAELFYTADHKWSSPLGMLTSLWSTSFRVSLVFYLFMLHTILAISAPLLLSRSYPFQTIAISQSTNLALTTFYPPSIQEIEYCFQSAVGAAGLMIGSSILDEYNSTAYVPRGSPRASYPSEMFFAGDSQQSDTVLQGLHIRGSCELVPDADDQSALDALCSQLTGSNISVLPVTNSAYSAYVVTSSCSSKPLSLSSQWMDNATSSFATAYMYISAANSSGSAAMNVSGIAVCNASYTTARAQVYGMEGAFDALEPMEMYNESTAQGGDAALAHPLTAALYALANAVEGTQTYGGNAPSTPENPVAVLRMWSYTPYIEGSNVLVPYYNQPTIAAMVDQLWAATLFMTGSIAVAGQKAGQPHDVVEHLMVSGRVREPMWAAAAWAILALWFALIVLMTVLLFRPAIGDSLGSYVAGRLLAENPELVRDKEYGRLKDNENMLRAFP